MLLNRCPAFLWQTAELDGRPIGVIAISGGGRPYFPLRDKGVLKRHVPLVRVGSSTDIASPDQVVAWAEEDHGGLVRRLELQKLEAELAVRAVLVPAGYAIGGGRDAQFNFHFINESLSSIELTAANVSWRLDREILQPALTALHVRLLDLAPEVSTRGLFRRQTLRSKDVTDVAVRVTQPELIEAFRGPLLARVEGSVPRDALGTIIIASCVGTLRCDCVGLVGGQEGSAQFEIRWPGQHNA
jgi:hypothetical protein